MLLTSPAFAPNTEIPSAYTCEGKDTAPPLAWSDAPPGTKTFALVVDDPDAPDPRAPKIRWVHWVLYDLPASNTHLAAGAAMPPGARVGLNDWKHARWGGPCPPVGRHRYVFTLYAVDAVLPDLEEPTKAQLEKALEGHVLGRAELVGTYQKRKGAR